MQCFCYVRERNYCYTKSWISLNMHILSKIKNFWQYIWIFKDPTIFCKILQKEPFTAERVVKGFYQIKGFYFIAGLKKHDNICKLLKILRQSSEKNITKREKGGKKYQDLGILKMIYWIPFRKFSTHFLFIYFSSMPSL